MTDLNSLAMYEQNREISFSALLVRQPVGVFYSAVIPAKKLIDICWFDIRRIGSRDRLEDFMGIQREIDPKRIKKIKEYVRGLDPTFPTAIVIAVDERCAKIKTHSDPSCPLVEITLRNYPDPEPGLDPILYKDIARVIDGQHRLEGLRDLDVEFELSVSLFIGPDIATQASIFSTVNLAQTKVNKSLVFDLFSYAETPSPEKMCHSVAVVLDGEPDSPFYERIKRLGVATEGRFGETLSQATFVKGLIQYISRDVAADREAGKRGRGFPKVSDAQRQHLILRDFFTAGRDDVLADVIWNYFDVVKDKWPDAWKRTGRGWVLNKTAGYFAFMRLFEDVYLSLVQPGGIPSRKDFKDVFAVSNVSEEIFSSANVQAGTSGQRDLYLALKASLNL